MIEIISIPVMLTDTELFERNIRLVEALETVSKDFSEDTAFRIVDQLEAVDISDQKGSIIGSLMITGYSGRQVFGELISGDVNNEALVSYFDSDIELYSDEFLATEITIERNPEGVANSYMARIAYDKYACKAVYFERPEVFVNNPS